MWAHPKHQNKSILIIKKQKQPKTERDLAPTFFFYSISHMFAIHLLK